MSAPPPSRGGTEGPRACRPAGGTDTTNDLSREEECKLFPDKSHNPQLGSVSARRLHTVMERLLETISFDAADRSGATIAVDGEYVDQHLIDLVGDEDLTRYIL